MIKYLKLIFKLKDTYEIYKEEKGKQGYEDMEQKEDFGAGSRAEKYMQRIKATCINLNAKGFSIFDISKITDTPERTVYGYLGGDSAIAVAVPNGINNKTEDD